MTIQHKVLLVPKVQMEKIILLKVRTEHKEQPEPMVEKVKKVK